MIRRGHPAGSPRQAALRLLAPALLLASLGTALAATDMLGNEVAVPASPRRVVSLLPSITETAFALGRGDRLVGRTSFCLQPPEAAKLAVVGDISNPSTEAVLVLEPDLLLTVDFGVNRGPLESFTKLNLPIYYLDFKSYETALDSIGRMGEILEAKPEAAKMIEAIRAAESDVRRRSTGLAKPRVLVAIGHGPVWVAGKDTFLDYMLEAAGAQNATDRSGYGPLETEGILLAAPDIVLIAEAESQLESAKAAWNAPELAELPARKNQRIAVLPERGLSPGPHMAQAFQDVLRVVHPEAAP